LPPRQETAKEKEKKGRRGDQRGQPGQEPGGAGKLDGVRFLRRKLRLSNRKGVNLPEKLPLKRGDG